MDDPLRQEQLSSAFYDVETIIGGHAMGRFLSPDTMSSCAPAICRRQLYTWRMNGLIPYFKLGKAVRFRVGDVLEALEDRRVC